MQRGMKIEIVTDCGVEGLRERIYSSHSRYEGLDSCCNIYLILVFSLRKWAMDKTLPSIRLVVCVCPLFLYAH
jgi:hypothetical protein